MKKLICLMGGVLLIINAYSQKLKYLTVGDTMPNILISNIVNGNRSSIRLYDIGKPLIFDCFATHCGGCIQLMPHVNELQKEHKDSLAIYIETYESPKIIQKFLTINPNAKNISLPFFTNDTILEKISPFHTIPNEIWIGNDHVIKAITNSHYINEENILKFIKGKPLHLPVKNDYLEYDPLLPLANYEQGSRFFFASTLTGYLDNLPIYFHKTIFLKDSLSKKIVITNSDLLAILKGLTFPNLPENRIQLLIKDSSKVVKPIDSKVADFWFFNHSYCYELTIPRFLSEDTIRNLVLQDLSKSLGLNIRFISKEMPCYVIVKTDESSIDPVTKGGEGASNFYPEPGQQIFIQNKPLSWLVGAMNATDYTRKNQIVLDETGIKCNLDLKINSDDIRDMLKMDSAFRPYGLKIVKAVRPIKMFVISDF